jgi:hypothetical protein
MDHRRRSNQGRGSRGGQQSGPEEAANSSSHVGGSFHGGHLPPPLFRRGDRPRMVRVRHRGAAPRPVSQGAVSLRWCDDLGRPPEAR